MINTLPLAPAESCPALGDKPKLITEHDAIDIWIARWLRVRRKDLLARYNCDPRRLYEVWQGERMIAKAMGTFKFLKRARPVRPTTDAASAAAAPHLE